MSTQPPSSDPARVAAGFLPIDWIADLAYVRSFDLSIPFPLIPKTRARVFTKDDGKVMAAQPKAYRRCVDDVSFLIRAARPTGWKLTGTYAILGVIRVPMVTSGDLDNLVGTVMDAGNGLCWLDDRQVGFAPVLKTMMRPTTKAFAELTIFELFEGWLDASAATIKHASRPKIAKCQAK